MIGVAVVQTSEPAYGAMRNLLKRLTTFVGSVLLAVLLSALSMFVQTAIDESERETIGMQQRWGFPVSYKTTASGMAWARYDGTRFAINSAVWFVVVVIGWAVAALIRCRR
jgi:hypothetical protein